MQHDSRSCFACEDAAKAVLPIPVPPPPGNWPKAWPSEGEALEREDGRVGGTVANIDTAALDRDWQTAVIWRDIAVPEEDGSWRLEIIIEGERF